MPLKSPEMADFRQPVRIYPNKILHKSATTEGEKGVMINFALVIKSYNECADDSVVDGT